MSIPDSQCRPPDSTFVPERPVLFSNFQRRRSDLEKRDLFIAYCKFPLNRARILAGKVKRRISGMVKDRAS